MVLRGSEDLSVHLIYLVKQVGVVRGRVLQTLVVATAPRPALRHLLLRLLCAFLGDHVKDARLSYMTCTPLVSLFFRLLIVVLVV